MCFGGLRIHLRLPRLGRRRCTRSSTSSRTLGSTWPRRQHPEGCAFGKLIFIGPVSALPRVLTFFTRLRAVLAEPSSEALLRLLRRPVSESDWTHLELQLEMARVAIALGHPYSFEPPIPGSDRKGDLLISLRTGEQILVETTALGTAQEQILDDRVHTQLGAALTQIATNHAVCISVTIHRRQGAGLAGGSGIEELLNRIAILAGQIRSTGQPQAELSVDVHLRVEPDSTGQGSWTLTGPEGQQDLGSRLRRTAREKLIQSKGDRPVWLRIDSRDGMFTLTEWSKRDDILRLDEMATYLVPVLDDAPHLAGLIYSSGPIFTTAGAPAVEHSADAVVHRDRGTLIRRVLAPFVVKETLVIPARDRAPFATEVVGAYLDEPGWLDADLKAIGLPPLRNFVPATSPRGPGRPV